MAEVEKFMVIFQPSGRRGYVEKGKTLKEASVSLGVDIEGICGEIAICGKCKVRIEEGEFEKYGIKSSRENLSPLGPTEKKFFNLTQEQEGYRLSCQAKVQGDVVVFVPEESRLGKQVVRKAATERPIKLNPAVRKYSVAMQKASLDDPLGDWERLTQALEEKHGLKNLTIDYQELLKLQDTIREGEWTVTVSVWNGREVIKTEPGEVEKAYGLAVDVGSTTVAGYLCDLVTGKVVTTASMMNPQVIYGEDVMSRISYTMTNPDGLKILNQAIIDGLNGIVEDVASQAGILRQDIVDMSIVGNTCMQHLFLNLNPYYIGRAPFPPALHHSLDIKAREWGLKIEKEVKKEITGNSPPCQVGCPAGVNGQDFLYLTAQGKYAEALELVRLAIPFAGVLGRVCTHPCEQECERGKVDQPLSLRSMHRFLADHELTKGRSKAAPVEMVRKEKPVAVIGSGPAGLTCAYELIRRGYPVTIFEAQPEAGGMLRYGIPDYRLPKKVLDEEIAFITELGVEIKTSTPVTNIAALFQQGFKAVFVAAGAWKSPGMGITGEDDHAVLHAINFLREVNRGNRASPGKNVTVIGGGNAAVDAARAAKRLGAARVTIVYRRSQEEMPAIASEVAEAEKEGIAFKYLAAPVAINASNGRVQNLKLIQMQLGEPDESGRRRPLPVEGSEFDFNTDSVILAVGQALDTAKLPPDIALNESGYIAADPVTLATSTEGVFAGGDCVLGPADAIGAVAHGQRAAISMELYLEGVDMVNGRPPALSRVENIPKEGVAAQARIHTPAVEPAERSGFGEVELTLSDGDAKAECKRCLNCGIYAHTGEEEADQVRGTGIHISPGAYVHVLPIEAGFVGSDNVGVLIAEEPYNQDKIELIIDIGTNGELIMGNRQRLISSSCATGPAFEGAEIKYGMRAAPGAIEKLVIDPVTKEVKFKVIDREEWNTEVENIGAKGMCGSAIIDVIPQLFRAGIIDRTGRFVKELNSPRLRETDGMAEFVIAWARETSINQDVIVRQDDIRAIQLAKGAMYAGAKIMMRTLGVEQLDKVILAGAFGSYIDKESAAVLGLFPDCDMEFVYAVGNAAGDGARMALLNVDKRSEADVMARKVEYVELTLAPDFDKVFAQGMWIPHMKDKFPHLEHLLPKKE